MKLFFQLSLLMLAMTAVYGQNERKAVRFDSGHTIVSSFAEYYKKEEGPELKYVPVVLSHQDASRSVLFWEYDFAGALSGHPFRHKAVGLLYDLERRKARAAD